MRLFSSGGTRKRSMEPRSYKKTNIVLACIAAILLVSMSAMFVRAAILSRDQRNGNEVSIEGGIIGSDPNEDSNAIEVPPAESGHDGSSRTSVDFATEPSDGDAVSLIEHEKSNVEEASDNDLDEENQSGNEEESDQTVSPETSETPEEPDSPHVIENGRNIEFSLDDSALRASAGDVSYYVYHFDTGNYSTSGSSSRMQSASVIKVFIMEYAFHVSSLGQIDMDTQISGTSILSYVTLMIQRSDNQATNILIDFFGMDALNEYFSQQGYGDTKLERRMLDFERRNAGYDNYTSMADCMAFLERLYYGRSDEPYGQMLGIMRGQTVLTKIPRKLPAGIAVANKTGELNDEVENDIGIVFAEGSTFAIVVLLNMVRSSANAQNAIADFALMAYNAIVAH